MLLPYGDNVERKIFPVIPIFLILMNVCVFLHTEQVIYNDNAEFEATESLYNTFGLSPVNFADGQVLGLLSHMFMHGGLMHLVGNMVVLWAMALSLEALMGRVALVVCYCAWGVIGGIIHCVADWGNAMPLVGASGAVAGLIGAYTVAFGPFAKLKCLLFLAPIPFKVKVPAALFGIFFIGNQLLEASSDPGMLLNISWYTHIGGFFAGAGTMMFFRAEVRQKVARTSDGGVAVDESEVLTSHTENEHETGPAKPVGEDYVLMQIAQAQAEMQAALEAGDNPACTACNAELLEEHLLSPTLARCPSPECGKLNYLEAAALSATRD